MLSHEGIDPKQWAALYALGALESEEKVWFEQHLRDCAVCFSEVRSFQQVVGELVLGESAVPPPTLREQLMARIVDSEETSPRAATGHHAATGPGVLFRNAGLLISRSSEIPWQPTPIPGMSVKALSVDPARKYGTSLVRLEPGACYPSHRHNDIEEVFLLEGALLVEGVRVKPGDYCRSEPGSIHGESRTESGALLLVFASQTDEILS